MPTKRTRVSRGRTTLTIDSFSIGEQLDFISGWRPPRDESARRHARWLTWEAYLSEWEAVRLEALAQAPPFTPPVFAELLRAEVRAGQDPATAAAAISRARATAPLEIDEFEPLVEDDDEDEPCA